MRSSLLVVMSLTLAATGFAQSRGGGGGFLGLARSFTAGGVLRGFTGGNFGRGFGDFNRGIVASRRTSVGVGLGYPGFYPPYYYDPYYYGAYDYGYPPYGYYAAPATRVVVPRAVIAPRSAVIANGGWRHFGVR
jgi:hypothetical protein